jgi:DNA-binding response OmpR family regulator
MAKKVLIIEDDTALYSMYATELGIKGYEVSNVADGNLGLEAVKTRKPDLVLLDLMLPGKNGLEILEQVKGDTEVKDIKVVMLTNFGNEDNISKALELGAEDYIMKYNIVPSDLSDKVSSILGDSNGSNIKFVN